MLANDIVSLFFSFFPSRPASLSANRPPTHRPAEEYPRCRHTMSMSATELLERDGGRTNQKQKRITQNVRGTDGELPWESGNNKASYSVAFHALPSGTEP